MEERNDRLIRYLHDAHAAEVGAKEMYEDCLDECDAEPDMASIFREQIALSENQCSRLEQRLEQLGSDTSGTKGFLNSVMAKIADWMQGAHDHEDKLTLNMIRSHALCHLQHGMYNSLAAYCAAIGDSQTAALATTMEGEEKAGADRFFAMIAPAARKTAVRAPMDTGRKPDVDVL